MSAAPVHALLERLEAVRSTGTGRWLARCPAHHDRSPSLAVRETSDGTVLVHCFAGCPVSDVVAAVGLELSDLFPSNDSTRGPLRPGERWVPRDALAAVAGEAVVVLVAADQVQRGETLVAADIERLSVAAGRLRAAAKEVGADV